MIEETFDPPANAAKPADELASLAGLAEGRSYTPRDDKGRFLTGNSGGGRPKGSKNCLTELFLSVVVTDFAEHGPATLTRLRINDPATYLRLVGALVPRELIFQREQERNIDYAELTHEEAADLIEQEQKRRFFKRAIEG